MKVLLWNLMRPNMGTVSRNKFFIDRLKEEDADIIMLTETNTLIQPEGEYFSLSSTLLSGEINGIKYKEGECRVAIFSRYPFVRQIPTINPGRSVCGEVKTPFGPLIVYGTVIGDLGGRGGTFNEDLTVQSEELTQLVKESNVLFGGDLNTSFSGPVYPSHDAVNKATALFKNLSLNNLTQHFPNNAIHCVISDPFLKNKNLSGCRESFDKKITDHSLISISIG